jgi:hypothetical protein
MQRWLGRVVNQQEHSAQKIASNKKNSRFAAKSKPIATKF